MFPRIMGILNVTPDSFSDGGAYFDPATAIEAGLRMIDEGADIIDVGPESTRPGSQPVSADEQIRRAVSVIEGIRIRLSDRKDPNFALTDIKNAESQKLFQTRTPTARERAFFDSLFDDEPALKMLIADPAQPAERPSTESQPSGHQPTEPQPSGWHGQAKRCHAHPTPTASTPSREITISIDTRLASVAEAAIRAGATMVNDTSALRDDPALVDCVAQSGVELVLMHRRGTPETMQQGGGPMYDDVVAEIREFLRERVRCAVDRGVDPCRILVDPGIGFGKRVEDNVAILRNVAAFADVGPPRNPHLPVLIGASRKRFIGTLLGIDNPVDRDTASVLCAVYAAHNGASVVRVHNVPRTVEAIQIWRHWFGGSY